MKKVLIFIWLVVLVGCDRKGEPFSDEYRNITNMLSVEEFEQVKSLVLQYGDREIYSSMYFENPHYAFEGFDAYLNPEVGQQNINCDPAVSDFNEIVILEDMFAFVYYYILLVRKGDLQNEDISFSFLEGMQEERVYLLKYYDYDLDEMEETIAGYITEMKNEVEITNLKI